MPEPVELVVPRTPGETNPTTWQAVVVQKKFIYEDLKDQLPAKVHDENHTVILYVGEKGISVASKTENGRKWHLVYFERYGIGFRIPVLQTHLQPGDPYRPTAEKLSALQVLSRPVLDGALLEWSQQGTMLDRYVKALWIGIRAQRPRLEALGIDQVAARNMFHWEFFIPTVEKICSLFRPKFRQAMNTPGQTISGLIVSCDKQTMSWPTDGVGIVYVRVYTHLDPDHIDVNNAGLYTGWTKHAHERNRVHTVNASTHPRETDRPSHYDIARMAPNCQVLIVLHQHDTESLGASGTPEARRMAEQTVMLMLRSYAPWTESSDTLDLYIQRAQLLQRVEKHVRANTGFQPNWRVIHGTNVSSPIFEQINAYESSGSPALIQALSILPPHPKLPGKTTMRATVSFHNSKRSGAATRFSGHRTGDSRSTSPVMIYLPRALATEIRSSVEQSPSREPFYATLAFELMNNGHEHERPYFGLPAVGPYQNFGAANSLGIRVEWKHHSLPRWFSAPIQISLVRHRKIATALMDGDATKMDRLYQEATALIQMLRGEECPEAPQGFWRSLGFRKFWPMIQRLEVNHLRQTIRWVPQFSIQVAPPSRSTAEENRRLLYEKKAPIMTVGIRLPKEDSFWYVDKPSVASIKRTVSLRCDTCTILSRRKVGPGRYPEECHYDPETQTCPPCRALNRICTFTPLTKLLDGWVGREVNHKDYHHNGNIMFPRYGGGPLRHLVPHLGMDERDCVATEITEPVGWASLHPFLESGEGYEDTEMGNVTMEYGSDDEDEDEEDL